MSDEKIPLDHKILKTLEAKLTQRFRELTKSLKQHDRETSRALPKNSKEAASVIGGMDLTEAEEKHESEELRFVREALERIQAGTYGACAGCGEFISHERLLALPYTAHCVLCQTQSEQRSRRP
jgi:RNA polymerase-binding transcription factor DksA